MSTNISVVDFLPSRTYDSGDYRLRWTGWKASRHDNYLCGQWIAYGRHLRQGIVVGVNARSRGTFIGGQSWDIRPEDGQPWFTLDMVETPEGREAMTRAYDAAEADLLTLVAAQIAGVILPVARDVEVRTYDRVTGEHLHTY